MKIQVFHLSDAIWNETQDSISFRKEGVSGEQAITRSDPYSTDSIFTLTPNDIDNNKLEGKRATNWEVVLISKRNVKVVFGSNKWRWKRRGWWPIFFLQKRLKNEAINKQADYQPLCFLLCRSRLKWKEIFFSRKALKFHSRNVSELSRYLLFDSVVHQDERKFQ